MPDASSSAGSPREVAFQQATPILRVSDFDASVAYYVDALGFELAWRDGDFGCVRRGDVALMLSEGAQGCGGTWVFLDVSDADALHEELRRRGEGIGLTTVYRTLQALAEAGEIDVLRTPAGEASYRRCSSHHHHHLVCRSCGRTVEVEGPAVESWASRVAAEHGFAEVDHTVEILGICAPCREAG